MTWQKVHNIGGPVLEILILAVGIYFATRFVRGTRGWPVVIGFALLLIVLSLASTLLHLDVLRWLLGNATGASGGSSLSAGSTSSARPISVAESTRRSGSRGAPSTPSSTARSRSSGEPAKRSAWQRTS